jgi:hypothetical protein
VLVRGETDESIASVKEIQVGFEFLASENIKVTLGDLQTSLKASTLVDVNLT